jgi:DUF4097 and DUF4098 domain-containing protein YvlB
MTRMKPGSISSVFHQEIKRGFLHKDTMTTARIAIPVFALAALSLGAIALPAQQPQQQQQAGETITVPLTDPARPGSVRVSVHSGRITVRGSNRRDVAVIARGGNVTRARTQPPPGLQRLNQANGLTITEDNNQVTITTGQGRGRNSEMDIEVLVPNRTDLRLSAHNNGIIVENVEGEIEVTSHNGAIRMTGVAGSVVADTHNGNVQVVLTRIGGDRPMAFLSYNGDVDVTLPAAAKANLKLRSDNGDIFTDFDVQIRPTAPQTSRGAGGGTRIESNSSINGAINGGGPEFELRTYNGDIMVRKGQ